MARARKTPVPKSTKKTAKPASSKPASKKPASKKPASKKPASNNKSSRPDASKKPDARAGLVDEALKARWTEALARYHKSRTQEISGWDDQFEALGEILDSDPPYYLAGGYKTARAFLQAEAPGQDERSVRMYVRVARWFDPEDEAKFGITKLDKLLDYLEASGGAPLAPAKIHLGRQTVKVARGKTERAVPFAEVTLDELRTATRAARAKAGKVTKSTEPPAVKVVRKALAGAKLGAISVRLRGGRLDLGGVALDDVNVLGKALAAIRLPE